MATKKYSLKEVEYLVSTYQSELSDDGRKEAIFSLSEEFGISEDDIIAKLTALGIYHKAPPKKAKVLDSKVPYISAIKIMIGARNFELPSLDKMSLKDLVHFCELLIKASTKQETK